MPMSHVGPLKHLKALDLEDLTPGMEVIEVTQDDRRQVTIQRIEREGWGDNARIFFSFSTTQKQRQINGWGDTHTDSVFATDYGAMASPHDGQWNMTNRFERTV